MATPANRLIGYVSREELAEIDKIASKLRVSRSWVVREAVIKFLEKSRGKQAKKKTA